jgi:DNA polymerase V
MAQNIPITSRAATGFVSAGVEYEEDDISQGLLNYLIPQPVSSFVFWMEDGAMKPMIEPGDLLIVDRSLDAVSGDLVVAHVQGKMIVRWLHIHENIYELKTENLKLKSFSLNFECGDDIFGVVTFINRKLRKQK